MRSTRRALMRVNSIDRSIVSSTPVKRPRSVSYESNPSSSSVISCESNSNSPSVTDDSAQSGTNSEISNCEDFRPRKKRKPNLETITYYYRYLDHSGDITQLEKYDINLFKAVNDKISYVSCVVKKITQIKHTSRIRLERRSMNLIHSDIDVIKKTSRDL